MNERTARKAREWLIELGVRTNLRGFGMIVDAVDILLEDPYAPLVRDVYTTVGQKHGVSASAVERNIRTAVESAFRSGGHEALEKMFGGLISEKSGKVDNGAFIHTLAIRLKDWEWGDES